ncbi:MAG: protease modulator HflC [Chthoniobacteraceae bacterium]
MKRSITILALVIVLLVLFTLSGGFFVVPETHQAIITQFGEQVGKPITQAGLHTKIPFTQVVHRFEKRVLEWDGANSEMPTKDKLYIIVDSFARWRIKDPARFFVRLRDERSALSRLEDTLGSEMRNAIARHELVELIRTTKDRKPAQADAATGEVTPETNLPAISYGRLSLEAEIAKEAAVKLEEFGLELLDFRFKRINYNPAVSDKIFERMISERMQIAERFRSQGAGEAAKILGDKERELRRIASEAFQKVQVIRGKADAEATGIYAEAFNASPEAREFYAFQRTMEVYREALANQTTLVLTTDNELLRPLTGEVGGDAAGSAAQPQTTGPRPALPSPRPSTPPAPLPLPGGENQPPAPTPTQPENTLGAPAR